MVFQYLARGYPTATAGRTGAQPLAHRAILRGCQGRVWFGSLPGPALGWAASASRAGDAGLQFFGASALDAYRPGRLFPPQGSARRSRRSIARCCCGSSKTSCYGSSRPIKLRIFALYESTEVVLGGCPRITLNASWGYVESCGSCVKPGAISTL